mgnify:CR=1 FL=1
MLYVTRVQKERFTDLSQYESINLANGNEIRVIYADSPDSIDYTAYGMTLRHLSRVICESIVRRAAVGKSYAVSILP